MATASSKPGIRNSWSKSSLMTHPKKTEFWWGASQACRLQSRTLARNTDTWSLWVCLSLARRRSSFGEVSSPRFKTRQETSFRLFSSPLRPNPSLKRSARQATRPGLAVRGTFSPARAWRPAVVARLARTLGIRTEACGGSSRKCACRRELNSHKAAKPPTQLGAVSSTDAPKQLEKPNSLISVRAGVSAGQSKSTRTLPEAARRRGSTLQDGLHDTRMTGIDTQQGPASRQAARSRARRPRLWRAL